MDTIINEDISVKRFAIDYSGPTLIVEYKTSPRGKSFLRKIRFKKIKPDASPTKVVDKLMRQFDDILSPGKVSQEQVTELVQLLLHRNNYGKSDATFENTKGTMQTIPYRDPAQTHKQTSSPKKDEVTSVLQFGDLNAVSEEENQRAKGVMDEVFEKKALRPGDDGYVYDKQVEFGEASEDNDWDEDFELGEDDF